MQIFSHNEETIVAQCTPQGNGALALIRLSGVDVLTVADRMCLLASGKKLSELPTHTIHFGWVVDQNGAKIDQVLFLLTHGPRTFTGQNTVEITSHNNQFICNDIIQIALDAGARLAKEGEFSKRAVLNNKIDVLQAEAINELIQANTPIARQQSLSQLEGSLSTWTQHLEDKLTQALALSEASFEFLDDEMSFAPQIGEALTSLLADIATISKTFDQQQQIRQGIRIALLGSVNAGKSSLFNALLEKDRAIVTNIPGTTRDTIEAGIYKNGLYWTLIDTAGLRNTHDSIEKAGIERSFQEAQKADVIILVVDRSRALQQEEQAVYTQLAHEYANKTIVVYNKTDLAPISTLVFDGLLSIKCSSQTRSGVELVERAIAEKIAILFKESKTPFLLNQRQYNLIKSIALKVENILPMLAEPVSYELVSVHIKDALQVISELTGRSLNEHTLDAVFKNFCVGK